MKRPYEEICRSEFDTLARVVFPHSRIIWEDVEADPPDWYLTVNQRRYAVEATTVIEFLERTGGKLSTADIANSLHEFIRSVEKSASDQGILNGAYIVSLCPIPNFSKNRKKLHDDLIGYIRRTQDLPTSPEFVLGYVREQKVAIQKEHDKKNYVTVGISMGVKWEGEAQEDLSASIARALSEKANKLRSISEPKILLLLDEYNYSFMSNWPKAIISCPDRSHFSCICRIAPQEGSAILWTDSQVWGASVTV